MLKGRELKGLKVLAGTKQEEIGRISDIFACDNSGKILGFAIALNGLMQRTAFVDIVHIRQISKNGIIIPNKKNIKRLPKNMAGINDKGWIGSPILDNKKQDFGTVADILIKNCQISGLEISGGLLNDLQSRRDFLPWQSVNYNQGLFYTGDDFNM